MSAYELAKQRMAQSQNQTVREEPKVQLDPFKKESEIDSLISRIAPQSQRVLEKSGHIKVDTNGLSEDFRAEDLKGRLIRENREQSGYDRELVKEGFNKIFDKVFDPITEAMIERIVEQRVNERLNGIEDRVCKNIMDLLKLRSK